MPEIGTILHSWGEIGCTFAQSAKSIILSVFVKLASFSERLPSVVENPAWSCDPFLSFSRLKRFHYSSIGVAFDRRMKCITASRYHPLKHHSLTFLSTLYPNVTLWTNKTPLFRILVGNADIIQTPSCSHPALSIQPGTDDRRKECDHHEDGKGGCEDEHEPHP